jgi:hypothetical protein
VECGVAELGDVMLSVIIKVNALTAVGSSALFGIKSFILQTSSNYQTTERALLQTLSDSVKEAPLTPAHALRRQI